MMNQSALVEASIIVMSPDEIMRDLGRDDIFPKAAMAVAGRNRKAMVPVFRSLLARLRVQSASEVTYADSNAVAPVCHLLAEWREASVLRYFLEVMRRPERDLRHLLGGTMSEASPRIVLGLFDGDLSPIIEIIEEREAYDFARCHLFGALALIAHAHPDNRPEIEAFVRKFGSDYLDAPADVLMGWIHAIIDLGLEDMTELVRDVIESGLIPEFYCRFSDFHDSLQKSLATENKVGNPLVREGLIIDAIAELSSWHCYSEEHFARQRMSQLQSVLQAAPSAVSGKRTIAKVGRNAPCPCGSGRKYKKCCFN